MAIRTMLDKADRRFSRKPSFPKDSMTRMLKLGNKTDSAAMKKAMTKSQEVLKSNMSGPQYRRSLSTQFRGFRRK